MVASLGEYTIEQIEWSGRNALSVRIDTARTDRFIQMYAGRKLVGVTNTAGLLTVTGQVQPTHCPTPVTIVTVDSDDRYTEYGHLLPRRPWNRWRVAWSASAYPADSRWFAISASPAAEAAVDYDVVLARVEYIGNGSYSFELPAVNECGQWTYGVLPYDNAMPNGNRGTPDEMAVEALVYPPDLLPRDDGTRFAAAIADGVLTVDFEFNWIEGAA